LKKDTAKAIRRALTTDPEKQNNMNPLKKLFGIKLKCDHCARAVEYEVDLTPITIRDDNTGRQKTLKLCDACFKECMNDFSKDPSSKMSFGG
jgi:hypothetical protein